MQKNSFSTIVLAAGVGKRMQSKKSKVLHSIGGKPMIIRTVEILEKTNPAQIIVVANPSNYKILRKLTPQATIIVQDEPLGTADAAKVGLRALGNINDVAVLYGDDTAFYKPKTILKVFNFHKESKAKITFVTINKENPSGLGRIIRKNGKLVSITEEKDAAIAQRKINEVNDGLYFFQADYIKSKIALLTPSKVTGELYITDLIELALKNKDNVQTYKLEGEEEWHGINTQTELAKANLKLNKSIHIMGICGAGAAAIAGISQSLGYKISGCDTNISKAYLKSKDLIVEKNHSKSHIKDISCLIYSPAIAKLDPNNEEIKEAQKRGIPSLTWQEFQGTVLMENKFTIAVAGAYGKSTTTAMIAKTLEDQQLDPTVEVGAKLIDWQNNFRVGNTKYYICEADEYNDNFLNYQPDIAVILNTSWDHPDYFKTEAELRTSYLNFVSNIKEDGILITTNNIKASLGNNIRGDIKIVPIKDYPGIKLKIIGDFRKENANAALTVAEILKLDIAKAKRTLLEFKGLARRLEYKGKVGKVDFYDDYAVQPYTIEKTANALKKELKDRKITLILEPHTFTRVNKFFNKFIETLKSIKVDHILIIDTYAAREKGDKSELSKKLAASSGGRAKYSGNIEDVAEIIRNNQDKFDVVLTMGAGNVYNIYDMVKNARNK